MPVQVLPFERPPTTPGAPVTRSEQPTSDEPPSSASPTQLAWRSACHQNDKARRWFDGFVTGQNLGIKQVGLALAIAVLVDDTLVRCLMAPSTTDTAREPPWWAP